MVTKKEVTTNDIMKFLQKQNGEMDQIMERLDVLHDQTTNIASSMATKDDIKRLDQRIDNVDQKISELDRRIYASDKKFESKFDLLFEAIGELKENFTIMDYKFIYLKRQVQAV